MALVLVFRCLVGAVWRVVGRFVAKGAACVRGHVRARVYTCAGNGGVATVTYYACTRVDRVVGGYAFVGQVFVGR